MRGSVTAIMNGADVEANMPVSMVRDDLDDIPYFELPSNYALKWYELGDEKAWISIHERSDSFNDFSVELFVREFEERPEDLPRRQCFILDESGTPIGTGTAWFNENYNNWGTIGRLHWIAIVPERQGVGLAKPLLTILCRRLKELGHQKAYLTTSTVRIPAINLYLKYGFKPEIQAENDEIAWSQIKSLLKYPLN